MGYNLEETSNLARRTHDQTVTTVEAGDGELVYIPTKLKANNMITMTTQMEVTWGQSNCEDQDTGSTESLVHGKGGSRRPR